ncbi:MAG: ATP-binding protein, partial [Acinetobacter sp.]
NSAWQEYQHIYENLLKETAEYSEQALLEPNTDSPNAQQLYQQFQHLTAEQQIELKRLIQEGDDLSTHKSLL